MRRPVHPHRHQVGALHDALGVGADPPVLHVERDAEVLADDHSRRDDLDGAAAVGEQLGHRRRVVEADLVDHHHLAGRVHRAVEHLADVGDGGRVVRRPTTVAVARRRWRR